MREILFRGKRTDNGEWVYGDLVENQGDYYIYPCENRSFYTESKCYEPYERIRIKAIKIILVTVGQFTGLCDKNGKRIFEGDILKGYEYPFCSDGDFNYSAEVIWFDNSPAFGLYTFKNKGAKVSGISEGNTEYIEDFNSDEWEVIGTIHDKETDHETNSI